MKVGGPSGSPAFAVSGTKKRLRRRRRLRLAAASLILLAGLALISYPFVSDWLNQRAQDAVSNTQQQTVAALKPADLSAEKAKAEAYNAHLRDGSSRVVDPFDQDDASPGNDEYESVLNVAGDGVMAELIIPSISVDLPIYHYTTEEPLSHGVGHVVNTSVPIGGDSTHSVLAGHTGLPTARLFDRLDELKKGDWFIIRVLGEDHAYKVYSTEVVLPSEVDSLTTEEGRDLVTLVTCTPYGVNTHRLLVHAERTTVPAGWNASERPSVRSVTPPAELPRHLWVYAIAGALAAIGILVIACLVGWIRKRRKRTRTRARRSKG